MKKKKNSVFNALVTFWTNNQASWFFWLEPSSLSSVVSEVFVRFFVEIVGHYSLFMGGSDRDEESSASSSSSPTPSSFQREAFRKAVSSKSLRRFLEVFMETQMFAGFVQEREFRRQGLKGLNGYESWEIQFICENVFCL